MLLCGLGPVDDRRRAATAWEGQPTPALSYAHAYQPPPSQVQARQEPATGEGLVCSRADRTCGRVVDDPRRLSLSFRFRCARLVIVEKSSIGQPSLQGQVRDHRGHARQEMHAAYSAESSALVSFAHQRPPRLSIPRISSRE